MKAIYAACILGLSASVYAQSDRWEYLGDGEDSYFLYDRKTLKRSGAKVYVWLDFEFKNQKTTKDFPQKTYWSTKQQWVLNCQERNMLTLSYILYASLNNTGEQVLSGSRKELRTDFEDAVPDSIGEFVLDTLCKKTSGK